MAPGSNKLPPIALFGYDSSPFTQKVRLVLKLIQIPYSFVIVPSMMPRPVLVNTFNLTYRKIPVLAVGKDVYADTSLIVDVLQDHPVCQRYRELNGGTTKREVYHNGKDKALSKLLSSYVTDRPLFRLTTGLIPSVVWRTSFGTDRAELIGHQLDADKLEKKVPRNLAGLDTFLSRVNPLFEALDENHWILGSSKPSVADVSFYYQLDWGERISRGEGIENLTGGGTADIAGKGMGDVFNKARYPAIWNWFHRFRDYVDGLPDHETRLGRGDEQGTQDLIQRIQQSPLQDSLWMLPTSRSALIHLEEQSGLKIGSKVSVYPADTGRLNPTIGTLIALSPEEVVIVPDEPSVAGKAGTKARIEGVRLHFPRVEFVISPVKPTNIKANL